MNAIWSTKCTMPTHTSAAKLLIKDLFHIFLFNCISRPYVIHESEPAQNSQHKKELNYLNKSSRHWELNMQDFDISMRKYGRLLQPTLRTRGRAGVAPAGWFITASVHKCGFFSCLRDFDLGGFECVHFSREHRAIRVPAYITHMLAHILTLFFKIFVMGLMPASNFTQAGSFWVNSTSEESQVIAISFIRCGRLRASSHQPTTRIKLCSWNIMEYFVQTSIHFYSPYLFYAKLRTKLNSAWRSLASLSFGFTWLLHIKPFSYPASYHSVSNNGAWP